jgi:glycosyltransferase involved in cell wall biosynthesis
MRIAFFLQKPMIGGMEKFIVSLGNYLKNYDFDITFLIGQKNDSFEVLNFYNIDYIDLNSSRLRYSIIKLYKVIKANKFDAVFSSSFPSNLVLMIAARLADKSVRLVFREDTIRSYSDKGSKMAFIKKQLTTITYNCFAYQVICPTEAVLDDLVTNYKIKLNKLICINNFIDLKRIRSLATLNMNINFDTEKINLVTVSALESYKNVDQIIEALARIGSEKYVLRIIGTGTLKEDLKDLVVNYNLENNVFFMGKMDNPFPVIAKSDALILASSHEGMPNVILEAMALGTLVISSDSPSGPREILCQGHCGYLYQVNEINDLIESITRVINYNNDGLIELANLRINDFDISSQIPKFASVLR